tara:strand:- start:10578 stop:11228 length:651 start_codon:yes stop_codon:yes gene_type:complete
MNTQITVLSLALLSTTSLSLSAADAILFNETVQEGGLFANGAIEIVSSSGEAWEYDGGLDVIKVTPGGSYQSGGLEFYGSSKWFTVPVDVDTLEFSVYVDTVTSSYMNGFTVNMNTGDFNIGTDTWTIDGVAGTTSGLTGGVWHTIAVDLTSVTDFDAGTSFLDGLVALKNNTSQDPYYIGDIRLTSSAIPESSAFAGIAGVMAIGIAVSRRRRRN